MAVDGAETSDRPGMSKVLDGIRTKREMKTLAKGLVRFKGGEVDTREVGLTSCQPAAVVALTSGSGDP